MVKVGFDISQVAHPGGVANYTQNLAKRLLNQKDLEMVFFYSSLRKPYRGNLPNVKSFRLPPTLFEVLFNKIRYLPIEKFIGEVDVFHSSDWVQPKTKAKKITTYHDVVAIKYPQWSHPKIVAVARRRLRLVEKEIDLVIAVSNSNKKDLLEVSKIPEKKIIVIYEGVGEEFRTYSKEKVENFRKKMRLPEEFILAIGGIGERRNLSLVKETAKGYNLVITGETLSWVSQNELPLLYNCAKLLLYPSFYEGFGLPILEAMSCGVPVVTSNISSMPEVGGKAALLVDPNNTEEVRRKVREVMEGQTLRKELIKKGLARAKQFSWQKCAQETAEVYRRLLK